jgi:hypothetical protein
MEEAKKFSESVSISEPGRRFRVGIYSPTDWSMGITSPSMTVELYPVFHSSSVTFEGSVTGELPETADGMDPGYVARKAMDGIRAEIEAEGELANGARRGDMSWILNQTEGYIRPSYEYRAVVWFVSERPGEISAVWVASADSVDRKTAAPDMPRGHRYKV